MRAASYVLVVVGIIIILVGVANHYVASMHYNFIAHTSTILGVVGVVIAVIGVAMMLLGGRKAA